jgi:hypothetical protein
MAFKKELKEKLKAFGLDPDKLEEAAKAEAETDVEIPADVTVIKTADLETRDANKLAEGKKMGEKDGENKGKELAAKAFKRKLALPDTVPNEIDKVIEAANEQLGKGDEGLKSQVAGLLKDKETLLAEKQQLETKAEQAAFDSELISYFPTGRDQNLSDAERLALVKMNLQFEKADGKVVVKRNGQIVQDANTHAPLAAKDVVTQLFTEKKWVAEAGSGGAGGRGGGDNTGNGGGTSGAKTFSAFTEKWKAENPGKNEVGPEFQTALEKHMKDVPDFDSYN